MSGAVAVVVVLQLLIAVLAARVAESRGRSFWVYAVACFFIPLAAFIAVPFLLIFGRRVPPEARPSRVIPVQAATSSTSRVDALERLAQLRDSGALTADEFEQEKRRLLGETSQRDAASPP